LISATVFSSTWKDASSEVDTIFRRASFEAGFHSLDWKFMLFLRKRSHCSGQHSPSVRRSIDSSPSQQWESPCGAATRLIRDFLYELPKHRYCARNQRKLHRSSHVLSVMGGFVEKPRPLLRRNPPQLLRRPGFNSVHGKYDPPHATRCLRWWFHYASEWIDGDAARACGFSHPG